MCGSMSDATGTDDETVRLATLLTGEILRSQRKMLERQGKTGAELQLQVEK